MASAELAERRRALEASVDASRRELARALRDLQDAARETVDVRDWLVRHRYALLLGAFAVGVRVGQR